MLKTFCDACKREIIGAPLVVQTIEQHHHANFRKNVTLCLDCELEIFFAISNKVRELSEAHESNRRIAAEVE